MSDDKVTSWERRTEWPLSLLAVSFLAAYAIPILAPGIPARAQWAMAAWTWLVWGVFAVDYAIRWQLSSDRGRFVRRNLLDLVVIVLPTPCAAGSRSTSPGRRA